MQQKNKKDLINIYIKIGDLFKDAGKFDDALLYYNKSLSLAEDLKNPGKQVQILNVIASMYESKGEIRLWVIMRNLWICQ